MHLQRLSEEVQDAPPLIVLSAKCSFRVSTSHQLHGDEAALLEVVRWDLAMLFQCDVGLVTMRGVEQGRGYLDLHTTLSRGADMPPEAIIPSCEAVANADLQWLAKYLHSTASRMAPRILIVDPADRDACTAPAVSLIKQGNDIVVQPIQRRESIPVVLSPQTRPRHAPPSPPLRINEIFPVQREAREREARSRSTGGRWSAARRTASLGGSGSGSGGVPRVINVDALGRHGGGGGAQRRSSSRNAPPTHYQQPRNTSTQYGFRSASPRVHTFAPV